MLRERKIYKYTRVSKRRENYGTIYHPDPHFEIKHPREGSRTDIERRMFWAGVWRARGVKEKKWYPKYVPIVKENTGLEMIYHPVVKVKTNLLSKIGKWLMSTN